MTKAALRVRILTQNLWHGLDHTQPLLMLPAENPVRAWLRKGALLRGLRRLRHPEARLHTPPTMGASIEPVLDVFCLQEVNPIDTRLAEIGADLGMEGHGQAANVGLRVGRLSYPPFLQEGVGLLWAGPAQERARHAGTLSGQAFERELPSPHPLVPKIKVGAHLAERRVFAGLELDFAGTKWLIVNVHLHSGAAQAGASARRQAEVRKLLEWLLPRRVGFDGVVLAGDFNSDVKDPEMQLLADQGFSDLAARDAEGQVLPTWDPFRNGACLRSLELAPRDSPQYAWDNRYHCYDHIWTWTRPGLTVTSEVDRVFDDPVGETWISDHFGLLATLRCQVE